MPNTLRLSLLCALFCTASLASAKPRIPILGFVPEHSYTLGPTTSFDFETDRFVLGVEAAAAKKIFWTALSTRAHLGDQNDFSMALDLGLNVTLINVGLGYEVKSASFERSLDPLSETRALHGPSLIVAAVIPLADPKSDGRRLLGAVPLIEPYYRVAFFFSEGFAHEFGLSFRLWWLVRHT
jgi:hypothetical protein